MEKSKYSVLVKKHTPKENIVYNALVAFITGGLMGILGEFLINVYSFYLDIPTKEASCFMIITLIFLGCLFTCLGFLINGLIFVNVDLLSQLRDLRMRCKVQL